MSRIGKAPVLVPAGVKVSVDGQNVVVEGPKGKIAHCVHGNISVSQEGETIVLVRCDEEKFSKSVHGTSRAIVQNMIQGVSAGFEITMNLVGVGYRVEQKGKSLNLLLGFSHPVLYDPPEGITLKAEGTTKLIISGVDKQAVGQVAAEIRKYRPPEPYKGKGVLYDGEVVKKKQGKRTGK